MSTFPVYRFTGSRDRSGLLSPQVVRSTTTLAGNIVSRALADGVGRR